MNLADLTSLLIIGGSILFFILVAGIHAPLVDASIIRTPYMIGFAFLAIVGAMSCELGSVAVRAGQLSREVKNNERRWRSLLEGVGLLVVGADAEGRINYVNPYFGRITGRDSLEIMGQPAVELVVLDERE